MPFPSGFPQVAFATWWFEKGWMYQSAEAYSEKLDCAEWGFAAGVLYERERLKQELAELFGLDVKETG
jgi:hypothetical protein